MLQITYQNKLEDIQAYADYMARTEQGKAFGRYGLWAQEYYDIAWSALIALLFSIVFESKIEALLVLVGLFALNNALMLLRMRFKPVYYVARQSYLGQEKKLTPRQRADIGQPRTLSADSGRLELSSPLSFRRCSWECIEKIELTKDFVFIHADGCRLVYIPRRDFPSEEAFKEFGQTLTKLWRDHEAKPGI